MSTRPHNRTVARRQEQGGFVLPLFAISLTVLLGFAGVGVDVWNWYLHAGRLQRAADAGALAGSVFMPDSFPTAQSTANAATLANGYGTGVTVASIPGRAAQLKVTVTETVNNNFLQFFGNTSTPITRDATGEYAGRVPMGSPESWLCQDPTNTNGIRDCWVSDSGRGTEKQGGDRYQSQTCPNNVINTSSGGLCPSSTGNPEYDANGYTFVVRVQTAGTLTIQIFDPAHVPQQYQDCGEAETPSFGGGLGGVGSDGNGDDNLPIDQQDFPGSSGSPARLVGVSPAPAFNVATPAAALGTFSSIVNDYGVDPEISTVQLESRWDDANRDQLQAQPFNRMKKWCVGDVDNISVNDNQTNYTYRTGTGNGGDQFAPNSAPNMTQSFIVRAPDNTPTSDLDNPVIAGCTPQFAPWQIDGAPSGGSARNYYNLLDNDDGYRDIEAAGLNASGTQVLPVGASFSEQFRRWVTICTVSSSAVATYITNGNGTADFIVQAQSNLCWVGSTTTSGFNGLPGTTSTCTKEGRNHFGMRAYLNSAVGGTGVQVYANGRLPMAAAARGANTTFYLAKVGPQNAGRRLAIEFFDVGDANVAGTLSIQRPNGAAGDPWTCVFTRVRGDNGNPDTPSSSGCTLSSVQSTNGYQGSLTTAVVSIPVNYNCNIGQAGMPTPIPIDACWVRIVFSYPATAAVLDHTVWSAGLVGDPVRLVE